MNRRVLLWSVIPSLALPSSLAAQTARDTVEARQAVLSFFDVLNTHQLQRAAAYTTDDWLSIRPDGGRLRGRDAVLRALEIPHATFLKDVTLTIDEIDVRFATSMVAIVNVLAHASPFTTPDGVKHENEQRLRSFVVVNRNGRWLIQQDQSTTVTRR
jgi:uncharacterized protein (TIGR02246 family)